MANFQDTIPPYSSFVMGEGTALSHSNLIMFFSSFICLLSLLPFITSETVFSHVKCLSKSVPSSVRSSGHVSHKSSIRPFTEVPHQLGSHPVPFSEQTLLCLEVCLPSLKLCSPPKIYWISCPAHCLLDIFLRRICLHRDFTMKQGVVLLLLSVSVASFAHAQGIHFKAFLHLMTSHIQLNACLTILYPH